MAKRAGTQCVPRRLAGWHAYLPKLAGIACTKIHNQTRATPRGHLPREGPTDPRHLVALGLTLLRGSDSQFSAAALRPRVGRPLLATETLHTVHTCHALFSLLVTLFGLLGNLPTRLTLLSIYDLRTVRTPPTWPNDSAAAFSPASRNTSVACVFRNVPSP